MLAHEATALEDPDINSFELFELAAVHAGLGETEKAAELKVRCSWIWSRRTGKPISN